MEKDLKEKEYENAEYLYNQYINTPNKDFNNNEKEKVEDLKYKENWEDLIDENNNKEILRNNCINNNENLPKERQKDEIFRRMERISYEELKEKKNLNDDEIYKILHDKRAKMNSYLLKVLSEEKSKEEEREILYNNTTDILEKKRLEKIISKERTNSSERILDLNE